MGYRVPVKVLKGRVWPFWPTEGFLRLLFSVNFLFWLLFGWKPKGKHGDFQCFGPLLWFQSVGRSLCSVKGCLGLRNQREIRVFILKPFSICYWRSRTPWCNPSWCLGETNSLRSLAENWKCSENLTFLFFVVFVIFAFVISSSLWSCFFKFFLFCFVLIFYFVLCLLDFKLKMELNSGSRQFFDEILMRYGGFRQERFYSSELVARVVSGEDSDHRLQQLTLMRCPDTWQMELHQGDAWHLAFSLNDTWYFLVKSKCRVAQ